MQLWWNQKGSNRNDGQLCHHGGVKELSYTPHTIMVEFASLALAVGKGTEPLVGVRYIYLRKMSSYGGELRGVPPHFRGMRGEI